MKIWTVGRKVGVENIFTKILACKHLQLYDPHVAFMFIGHMGAKDLIYYAFLEWQWMNRHQLSNQTEKRVISWQNYSTCISSQFYAQTHPSMHEWQLILRDLHRQIQHFNFVPTFLFNNVQRLCIVSSKDLSASSYLFQYDNRLEKYIKEVTIRTRRLLNIHGQIQLEFPPLHFSIPPIFVTLPLMGSPLILQYLEQYHKLFDYPQERHVPTWQAITWLLEDYGLSRTEEVPVDIHYCRISRQWYSNPPLAVATHPNLCLCLQRHKWDPQATLHSVEYNWPLIPGPKTTATNFQATYYKLF